MRMSRHGALLACAVLALLLTVGFAATGLALEPPPADGSVTADQAYRTARRLYDDRQFEDALAWLRYAHEKSPSAAYLFGIARALEGLGRVAEAHEAFLQVQLQPRLSEDAKRQAGIEAARLEPLVSRAVVRLDAPPPGGQLQLDDRVVANTEEDQLLAPGAHTLCISTAGGRHLACWSRPLDAGRRVRWPPEPLLGSRGRVVLESGAAGALRAIDGTPLALDASAIVEIELDVGAHRIALGRGQRSWTVEVTVASGEPGRVDVPAVEAPAQPPDGPGVGPWILGAAGLGVAGAGIALLAVQAADRSELDASRGKLDNRGVIVGLTQAEAVEGYDRADALVFSGSVLAAVGVAAMAGAVVWLLVPTTEETVWVAPGGDGLLWMGGRF